MRWKLTDRPDSVKMKVPGEKIHPGVADFTLMEPHQQKIFRAIQIFILCLSPDAKCYAYGSRINGRWRESSDYDVAVTGELSLNDQRTIKEFDFGVRTDIRFLKTISINHCVEII